MKTALLWLLTGLLSSPALAQTVTPTMPVPPAVGDSMDRVGSPSVRRMGTGFYIRPGDPPNVMRASLDNMPVKTADPNRHYSMLNPQLRNSYLHQLPSPDSLKISPWLKP